MPHPAHPHPAHARLSHPRADLARADIARADLARERIAMLAWLLDGAIRIPFTRTRVGVDALAGLIPGVGDLIGKGLSAWLIWEARALGAPPGALARMCGNLAIDAVIGAVPLVGDVWDVVFRANERNLRILAGCIDDAGVMSPALAAGRS